MVDRVDREGVNRDREARTQNSWIPPSNLPDPHPQPGYVFRWIRTALYGQPDHMNVSRQFREGWIPVRAEDHPEIAVMPDRNSQFKGNIEIGGLLLCKMPKELHEKRIAYFEKLSRRQVEAMEHNLMRESDPRMPLMQPERRFSVQFGKRGGN